MLPWDAPPVLASGGELKNTFCLSRGRYAFVSHHIGDLENYETLRAFEDGINHFERLFRIRPEKLAYDLHPNYLATRYALERSRREGIPAIGVQHHHAHIAACLAENGWRGEKGVIGVAFDGSGYGEDGAIWGGEFLLADYRGYRRFAHLAYTPLPGGDAATRKPARIALAHLWQAMSADRQAMSADRQAGLEWEADLPPVQALRAEERSVLRSMLEQRTGALFAPLNTPLTSSMGRLFDAAASLAGIRQQITYEAQAAIEFEALADPEESGFYPFGLEEINSPTTQIPKSINPAPLFQRLLADWRAGIPPSRLSARFHNGVAEMVRQVVLAMRRIYQINEVALSGGVWQNVTLLTKTLALLQDEGFTIYLHHQLPPNDGGLSLGQAAVAHHQQLKG
jgi:hydrogenase maturation protein HypF